MFNKNAHCIDPGLAPQAVDSGAGMEVDEEIALAAEAEAVERLPGVPHIMLPWTGPDLHGHLPVPAEEALSLYREMVMIRHFEEEAAHAFTRNRIGGYFHTCIGQEASIVGMVSALREDDYLIASYREHGHALARGCTPREVMAELYGRATGSSRGKGGSMHIFDAERHFLGGTGIVGGNIPIGTGVAFALKYRETDSICACFFGDGAVNEGTFHEALNMAGLWRLPVLFGCENNLYGMGTHISRANAVPDMTERAAGYGMERFKVDGMDLFEVRALLDELVARMRRDRRPIFLESLTYRFLGHGSHDPGKYRTKEEVDEWKQRDPIKLTEEMLCGMGLLSDEQIEAADRDGREVAEDAARFAEESPAPGDEQLYTDIYA